jgi:integrase
MHSHARAVRTLLRFFHEEGYIQKPVKFQMPPSGIKDHLPYLTAEQVKRVLEACTNPRDKALVLLMVDSGLRRAETISLDWKDVDIRSGVVTLLRGKGGKSRSVVIGATIRRALLAYRRTLGGNDNGPLFQTNLGTRFSINGLRSLLLRISCVFR